MKKSVVLLMLLSLLVCSCAGTKYKNKADNTSKVRVSAITDKSNSLKEEEYVEYTENYAYFDFDLLESEFESELDDFSESVDLVDNIIQTAKDNLGVRYKFGGTTKSGFDCSGLVLTSFKAHDITLPRTSFEMAQYGTKIRESETQKGDLIFFITNGGKRINHVGIVTEVNRDEIKFIHASTTLGVTISSTKESYYKKKYVKIARVL